MQDIIKLLPDSVANQIAAGEVIQQPSSVVKELVENAVDAGANKIDIFIKDAGRTLIQVIDDGCGMTPTDARLAFERHSTSKIREAKDLFALTTMGFRGEALASIAAISQLDVRTMPHDATVGTRLVINGSKVESQDPEITAPGTNFMVKNIFFNVPARRKFLKKDSVEFANILHEFERLVLVNPQVEMALYHNDVLVHSLSRSNLKTRIGELFGRTVEDALVPIEIKTDLANISGYIGTPASARKRGALQYFFVNGRNMKHPYFRKAVLSCYEQLISPDATPNFFINFDIDPQSIDINIHPTKNEIKFDNEQAIWQILSAGVKESLGRFNLGPSLDFEQLTEIDIQPSNGKVPESNIFSSPGSRQTNYNPFKYTNDGPSTRRFEQERRSVMGWESLYPSSPIVDNSSQTPMTAPALTNYLQIGGKFIITPSAKGMYVINQREAHKRILYDRYMAQLQSHDVKSQNLLFTTFLELTSAQVMILDSMQDMLQEVGFDVSQSSNGQWEIKALPAVLGNTDGRDLFIDILKGIEEEVLTAQDSTQALYNIIALSMARGSAVKNSQNLTVPEMEEIVSALFATSSPSIGPDGAKIISELPIELLEKEFNK